MNMQRGVLNNVEETEKRNGDAVLGTAEVHAMDQLKVQRENLLGIARMCVKSLVDLSPFEVIIDDCPHVKNLCIVLEHIFLHRMQPRWSLFSSSDAPHFWHIIQFYGPEHTVVAIDDMANAYSDIGKCRAWLRLCLVQKRLATFTEHLLNKQTDLQSLYMPGAFLLSSEMIEISGTLKCLDAIDFNLCVRDSNFDQGDRYEINYSPYLRFEQSATSRIDDLQEEQKLRLSPGSIARLSFLRRPSEGEESKDDSLAQLRELLKTEREQKNYFEELVSVRDMQISRLQSEMESMGRESEKQRGDMESIILELQQQVTKLQEEVRQWQQKYRNRTTGTPSQQNRRSGIFSGLFGSGDDSAT